MLASNLFHSLNQFAKETPRKTAIFDGEKTVSYESLYFAIGWCEELFNRHQLKCGDRIGIFLPPTSTAYIAIWSATIHGLTYVPLPMNQPASRLLAILRSAKLNAVICFDDSERDLNSLLEKLGDNVFKKIVLQRELENQVKEFHPTPPPEELNDRSPLYLMYTSGSTGEPKGVQISHHNVLTFCIWAKDYLKINSIDHFLAHTPLTFDLSVFNLFTPLLSGASIRLVHGLADQMYPGSLLEKGVTIALFVPRVTGLMLEAGQLSESRYPSLRHLIFCGEKLWASQVNAWMNLHSSLQIHNLYGPTEATVGCTCFSLPMELEVKDPVPIGTPLPKTRIEIVDQNGNPTDRIGEIVICGDQVSSFDYWEQHSDRFFDDPFLGRCFRSGDLGYRNNDQLYWSGRIDNQIKHRGFRIELGDIESALSLDSRIGEVVCAYDSAKEQIVAFVSIRSQFKSHDWQNGFRALAETHLPSYMWPENYYRLDAIPKTENGKVDRKKIAELLRVQDGSIHPNPAAEIL